MYENSACITSPRQSPHRQFRSVSEPNANSIILAIFGTGLAKRVASFSRQVDTLIIPRTHQLDTSLLRIACLYTRKWIRSTTDAPNLVTDAITMSERLHTLIECAPSSIHNSIPVAKFAPHARAEEVDILVPLTARYLPQHLYSRMPCPHQVLRQRRPSITLASSTFSLNKHAPPSKSLHSHP